MGTLSCGLYDCAKYDIVDKSPRGKDIGNVWVYRNEPQKYRNKVVTNGRINQTNQWQGSSSVPYGSVMRAGCKVLIDLNIIVCIFREYGSLHTTSFSPS